ncbi:hypothetical protein Ahy_A07g037058 isoform B [Arachis hypogaea]|uniref:Aminotransferase-like plant mobile domain-containing protein n=1 Tax=Arachis hypogaea TaxID=3818 RepID=A0A445CHN8_ARAHY|nr:hypothetical protein Ahy_A07g037058 isoform B [Arachis hypogaea]
MHTFHMSFRECMIILQDVAYQLGLPIDGQYINGCLTDFVRHIEGGCLAWVWFEELLGVLPPANCIDKFTMKCTWFQETFSELPQGADNGTVSSWLPYVARLEDMGQYSWGSAALSWLYRCMRCLVNRNVVKLAGTLQLL